MRNKRQLYPYQNPANLELICNLERTEMIEKKIRAERSLPNVLLTASGNVDIDYLRKLLQFEKSPGKKTRELLAELAQIRLNPTDETTHFLATAIWSRNFRFCWYKRSCAKRKDHFPSLAELVLSTVGRSNEVGYVFPTKINGAFEKKTKTINGKKEELFFPLPEKISLVVNVIARIASNSARNAALYTWALTELIDYAIEFFPSELSLKGYNNILLEAIEARRLDDVIDLMKTVELLEEPPATEPRLIHRISEPAAKTAIQEINSKIQQIASPAISALSDQREIRKTAVAAISKLRVSVTNLDANLLEVDEIISSAQDAKEKLHAFAQSKKDSISKIQETLLSVAPDVNIRLDNEYFAEFKCTLDDDIEEEIQEEIKELIRKIDLSLPPLTEEERREIRLKESYDVKNFKEIGTIYADFSAKRQVIRNAKSSSQHIRDVFEDHVASFEWDFSKDGSISHQNWIDVAAGGLLNQESSWLLALSLRATDLALPLDELPGILLKKSFAISPISFLHMLTLRQVERLASEHRDLYRLVQVSQFCAFLYLYEIRTEDSYSLWSVSPLSDIVGKTPDTAIGVVIQSIYMETNSNKPISPVRLRLLLTYALKSTHANTEIVHGKLSYQELIRPPSLPGQLNKLCASVFGAIFLPQHEAAALNSGPREYFLSLECMDLNIKINEIIGENIKSEHKNKILNIISCTIKQIGVWAEQQYSLQLREVLGDISNHEITIVNSIGQLLNEGNFESRVLVDWLLQYCDNKLNGESLFSPSLKTGALWDEAVPMFVKHASKPRSFYEYITSPANVVSGYNAATDLVSIVFGFNSTSETAKLYLRAKFYDGYQALAKDRLAEISPDLDRQADSEIEAHGRSLESRLAFVVEEQELIPIEFRVSGEQEVSEVGLFLQKKNWHLAARSLERLHSAVEAAKQEFGNATVTAGLRREIEEAGGQHIGLNSIAELRKALDEIIAKSAPRRKHLRILESIVALQPVNREVAELAKAAISHLRKPTELPSAEQADYIEYLLQETFQSLTTQLRRSRQFIATYAETIIAIAKILLNAMLTPGAISRYPSHTLTSLETFATAMRQIEDAELNSLISLKEQIATTFGYKEVEQNHDTPDEEFSHSVATHRNRSTAQQQIISTEKLLTDFSVLFIDELDQVDEMLLKHWLQKFKSDGNLALLQHVALVALASKFSKAQTVIPLVQGRKGPITALVSSLILRLANIGRANPQVMSLVDSLEYMTQRSAIISQAQSYARAAFSECNESNPGAIRWLWDSFSGESKQAEGRAALLTFLSQCDLPYLVALCLTYSPVDFDSLKAKALAEAGCQVYKTRDRKIIQTFSDQRRSSTSKAFAHYAEQISTLLPAQSEQTADISLLGELEVEVASEGKYTGTLIVSPNTSDWPQYIDIELPPVSALRNSEGGRKITLEGPFVSETMVKISLTLEEAQASSFVVEASCSAISISGVRTKFPARLDVVVSGAPPFQAMSKNELETAFDSFPSHQMRGDDYVPRVADEQRLERALVTSNTTHSIWISSPRRSGKTSALYRIVDQFSHKANRDIAVIFLTVDRSFESSREFNSWVWRKIIGGIANSELRSAIPSLQNIGVELPIDEDCGTFFMTLSDRILKNPDMEFFRVIYLIDEVDRFASMHFEGGVRRDTARDVMWQIRNVIGARRDVGFVFAGSSAAKKLFVTNPESPFFNSIGLLELTPFSCESKKAEEYARAIVEPNAVRGRYYYPTDTLKHLIWICSGIPYYMKLLSGATMSLARQRYLLKTDVNEGLRGLLGRGTGISLLDDTGGEPGADELRTMALEVERDKVLARAALYAVAEMQSPVAGQKLHRGRLSGDESPLVVRYELSKPLIEKGLDIVIDLGILTLSTDRYPEVFFTIPMLGESIRTGIGRNWAYIDHQLHQIASEGN